MKRMITAVVVAFAAASLFAGASAEATTAKPAKKTPPAAATKKAVHAPAASAKPAAKVVAVVNGEIISREDIDRMWFRMAKNVRDNYEKAGGKGAFVDNYIRKRLVVQQAVKLGLDQNPDVQAEMRLAAESALFDRYIRDVVGATIVPDADMIAYYNSNKAEFTLPEEVKVRHIVVMPGGKQAKTREEAKALVEKISRELSEATKDVKDPAAAAALLKTRFSEAAQKYSGDGTAPDGGALPWTGRGAFDQTFEQAAFALKPGAMSPVVETPFGFHLILVEGKRGGTLESFDDAKAQIREDLITLRSTDVMGALARLTNDLRLSGKVVVTKENME